jgi:hypothetical protein
MEPSEPAKLSDEIEPLVEELVRRWIGSFVAKDWSERLEFLNQLHEQLLEDLGDLDLYCAVSPVFIRRLIEDLSEDPVGSAAQANVYANSESEEHRQAAGAWLTAHRGGRSASE